MQAFLGYFNRVDLGDAVVPADQHIVMAFATTSAAFVLFGVVAAAASVVLILRGREESSACRPLASPPLVMYGIGAGLLLALVGPDSWREVWLAPSEPFVAEIIGSPDLSAIGFTMERRPIAFSLVLASGSVYVVLALMRTVRLLRLPSRRLWGLFVFAISVAIVAAGHSYLAYYDEHPFPPEHLTLALLQAATLLYLGLLFGLVGMTLQMFGDDRSDRPN